MRFAVYLPLLLSVVLAPPLVTAGVRRLPDRLHPRVVLALLAMAVVGLAVASTASLVLLVAGGIAVIEGVSASADARHTNPGGLLAGAAAGVVLLVAVLRLGSIGARTLRRRRRVHRGLTEGDPGAVGVVEDEAVYALAAPGVRGRCGRVVLSRGLLAVLDGPERAAVIAHEREHLDGHHHRYLVVGALAVALNPGLVSLRRDLGYALERCADEAAARRVDDRAVVARAIGRVALAAHRTPDATRAIERSLGLDAALMLGAAVGPVPRRVAALLSAPSSGPRAGLVGAALLALVVAAVAALAVAGAAHAAGDLADLVHSAAQAKSTTTM